MNRLSQRLKKLEDVTADPDDFPKILIVSFCRRDEDGEIHCRFGRARFLVGGIPEMIREDGESEDAFLMRAYSAVAPDGPADKLKGDDLVAFLAARDPDIARANFDDRPITDDMLQQAMTACAETS